MGYSRRTLNYLERITVFDWIHMLSMADFVTIGAETPMIDYEFFLEEELIDMILMNP